MTADRPRSLLDAAGSGALFGVGAACVGALVLVAGLAFGNRGASDVGGVTGVLLTLALGLFGGAAASPTGAVLGGLLGALNGVVARARWGQGWPSVIAVGVGLAGLLLAVTYDRGDWAGGLPAFVVVPALACAGHLRYEQRRQREAVLAVRPSRWDGV